jgi:hypothetical protein
MRYGYRIKAGRIDGRGRHRLCRDRGRRGSGIGAQRLGLRGCAVGWPTREAEVEAWDLAERSSDLSERDGALAAFEDLRISLTSDGGVNACWGRPRPWDRGPRSALRPEDEGARPVVLDAPSDAAWPRLDRA